MSRGQGKPTRFRDLQHGSLAAADGRGVGDECGLLRRDSAVGRRRRSSRAHCVI